MARDKKTESKGAVVGPGKDPAAIVTKNEPKNEKHETKAVARPETPVAAKPEMVEKPGGAKANNGKPAAASPEPHEAEADKHAAKAAPATSPDKSAPHMVSDDDPQPPAPNLIQIPAETKAGERETLLRPDQIDTTVAPETKAPAPGRAPRGDARSLRRGGEFCLIYRQGEYLVRREGKVGVLGNWSIVEYPSPAAAAHAYAQECSELTDGGFADHRP